MATPANFFATISPGEQLLDRHPISTLTMDFLKQHCHLVKICDCTYFTEFILVDSVIFVNLMSRKQNKTKRLCVAIFISKIYLLVGTFFSLFPSPPQGVVSPFITFKSLKSFQTIQNHTLGIWLSTGSPQGMSLLQWPDGRWILLVSPPRSVE